MCVRAQPHSLTHRHRGRDNTPAATCKVSVGSGFFWTHLRRHLLPIVLHFVKNRPFRKGCGDTSKFKFLRHCVLQTSCRAAGPGQTRGRSSAGAFLRVPWQALESDLDPFLVLNAALAHRGLLVLYCADLAAAHWRQQSRSHSLHQRAPRLLRAGVLLFVHGWLCARTHTHVSCVGADEWRRSRPAGRSFRPADKRLQGLSPCLSPFFSSHLFFSCVCRLSVFPGEPPLTNNLTCKPSGPKRQAFHSKYEFNLFKVTQTREAFRWWTGPRCCCRHRRRRCSPLVPGDRPLVILLSQQTNVFEAQHCHCQASATSYFKCAIKKKKILIFPASKNKTKQNKQTLGGRKIKSSQCPLEQPHFSPSKHSEITWDRWWAQRLFCNVFAALYFKQF